MLKRIISGIVFISLFFSVFSCLSGHEKAHAENKGQYKKIEACNCSSGFNGTETRSLTVYCEDDDFLFSTKDLTTITGFTCTIENNCIRFTRGYKIVVIDISANTVEVAGQSEKYKLEHNVYNENGTYYVSGISVLPWLNIRLVSDNNILYYMRDENSYWDIKEDLENAAEEVFFNKEGVYDELNLYVSPTDYAILFLQKNGLMKIIKNLVWIPSEDFIWGEYENYYNMFAKMFAAENTLTEDLKDLTKNSGDFAAKLKFADKVDKKLNLGLMKDNDMAVYTAINFSLKMLKSFVGEYSKFVPYTEDGVYKEEWITNHFRHYQAYNAMGLAYRSRMEWLEELAQNEDEFQCSGSVKAAAMKSYLQYGDLQKGIESVIWDKIVDVSMDTLLKMALEIVSAEIATVYKEIINTAGILTSNEDDEKASLVDLDTYFPFAQNCYAVYKSKEALPLKTEADLKTLRAAACMYLYSSSLCWNTMAKYASGIHKKDMANEYKRRSSECTNWMHRVISTEDCALNDAINTYGGNGKEYVSLVIRQIFSDIKAEATEPAPTDIPVSSRTDKAFGLIANDYYSGLTSDGDYYVFFPPVAISESIIGFRDRNVRVTDGFPAIGETAVFTSIKEDTLLFTVNSSENIIPGFYSINPNGDISCYSKSKTYQEYVSPDGKVHYTLSYGRGRANDKFFVATIYKWDGPNYDLVMFNSSNRFGGMAVIGETAFYSEKDESSNAIRFMKYTWDDRIDRGKSTVLLSDEGGSMGVQWYNITKVFPNGNFILETHEGGESTYDVYDKNGNFVRPTTVFQGESEFCRDDGSLSITSGYIGKDYYAGFVYNNDTFVSDDFINYLRNKSSDYYIDFKYSTGDIYYFDDNVLYVRRAGQDRSTSFPTYGGLPIGSGSADHKYDEKIYGSYKGSYAILFVYDGYIYTYAGNQTFYKIALDGSGNSEYVTRQELFPDEISLSPYEQSAQPDPGVDEPSGEAGDEWATGTWYLDGNANCRLTFTKTFTNDYNGITYHMYEFVAPDFTNESSMYFNAGNAVFATIVGDLQCRISYDSASNTVSIEIPEYFFEFGSDVTPGKHTFTRQ